VVRTWTTLGAAVGLALALAAPVRAAEPPPVGSIPLPLDRTGTVRAEGKTYYIDGAQVVPRTAEVTIQLGVTIIGINNASLDVQGGFKAHGTQDIWVTIRNVDFSPTRAPLKGVHLDMVTFEGCKWVHGETAAMSGVFTIENSCFQRDCTFDVALQGGFLKIMTVEFGMPCAIRCIRQKENPVPIEVEVRSSWMKAISLTGAAVANFRHSEIKGGLVCNNVTDVIVDGCDVSQTLSFLQAPEDSAKKIELTKINFFDGCRLVLRRKQGPDTKAEKVKLDKPYFGTKGGVPVLEDKEIAALIDDAEDDAEGTLRVWWNKANKRKHLLVNYDTLRMRAPPLK
jgi:hypothetical protein